MVTLEVWYNQEPENDYAEGEPAILVSSADDLEQLIARVQAETKDAVVPSMVECSVSGDPGKGAFYVGIGQDRGFVMFLAPAAVHTEGDSSLTEYVIYDYQANAQEIPARYEVPLEQVRAVALAFLEREELPPNGTELLDVEL